MRSRVMKDRVCSRCKDKFSLLEAYKSETILVNTLLAMEAQKRERLPVVCFKCYSNTKEIKSKCSSCKKVTKIPIEV